MTFTDAPCRARHCPRELPSLKHSRGNLLLPVHCTRPHLDKVLGRRHHQPRLDLRRAEQRRRARRRRAGEAAVRQAWRAALWAAAAGAWIAAALRQACAACATRPACAARAAQRTSSTPRFIISSASASLRSGFHSLSNSDSTKKEPALIGREAGRRDASARRRLAEERATRRTHVHRLPPPARQPAASPARPAGQPPAGQRSQRREAARTIAGAADVHVV